MSDEIKLTGHEKLWGWFGLSYASFLTMPRVLMHAMPDEWQNKMADLLEEYDNTFPGVYSDGVPVPYVTFKLGNRFVKRPNWMDYRHPDYAAINALCAPHRNEGARSD